MAYTAGKMMKSQVAVKTMRVPSVIGLFIAAVSHFGAALPAVGAFFVYEPVEYLDRPDE
jgi:hypothetical protein